jgi:hypothetical protein
MLQQAHLSPFALFSWVLDPENLACEDYRRMFYRDSQRLSAFMGHIIKHPDGKTKLMEWLIPHSVDTVCDIIHHEMEEMSRLNPDDPRSIKELSPKYLRTWDLAKCIADPARRRSPVLVRILHTTVDPDSPKTTKTRKNHKDSDTVHNLSLTNPSPSPS